MDALIVRPAGHPDLQHNMPSVSCQLCGLTAQIPAEHFGVSHWDEMYRKQDEAEPVEGAPASYGDAQWFHDRELEAWSQAHTCKP